MKNLKYLVSIFLFTSTALASVPLVQVGEGLLEGVLSNTSSNVVYKGIPYAAAPIGSLRFRAPEKAKEWAGVRFADEFGSVCPQTKGFNPEGEMVGNEDCLTLNIWQPPEAIQLIEKKQTGLPVMVFFHGGSFAWGSGSDQLNGVSIYDGDYMAARGKAIVITVNYRLGVFGFLTTTEGVKGNFGLLDQIAALKWIHKNIKEFGGDEKRVMIFGESAGAYSVLGLMVSPQAKGLFSRALMQSGSIIEDTADKAKVTGDQLVQLTSCRRTQESAQCIRGLPTEEILKASLSLLKGQGARIIFGPHIDGRVIPDAPLELLRSGHYNQVPLLLGTNFDEMSTLVLPELQKNPVYTEADHEKMLREQFGNAWAEKVLIAYPVNRFLSPLEATKAVFGDAIFHCPTKQVADVVAKNSGEEVFRYVFTHTFHLDPLRVFGAGHGMELSYVFHNFPDITTGFAPDLFEINLSNQIIDYWTQFARNGNPNQTGLAQWPRYYESSGKYQQLDNIVMTNSNYRTSQCEFWQKRN